jgi:hypothetical protein
MILALRHLEERRRGIRAAFACLRESGNGSGRTRTPEDHSLSRHATSAAHDSPSLTQRDAVALRRETDPTTNREKENQ